MDTNLILEPVVSCPNCGELSVEKMPTNACIHFYTCAGCGGTLTPGLKPGYASGVGQPQLACEP